MDNVLRTETYFSESLRVDTSSSAIVSSSRQKWAGLEHLRLLALVCRTCLRDPGLRPVRWHTPLNEIFCNVTSFRVLGLVCRRGWDGRCASGWQPQARPGYSQALVGRATSLAPGSFYQRRPSLIEESRQFATKKCFSLGLHFEADFAIDSQSHRILELANPS